MKGDVKKVTERMEPREAVAQMGEALKRLFPILDEEDRFAREALFKLVLQLGGRNRDGCRA